MSTRRSRRGSRALGLGLGLALLLAAPGSADAFCGFYVAGADAKLFNDATMVVLMRDGKRTVLSMQNDYQGPPEDFALVIPVPVVLQEGDVKTLPKHVFDRIDKLAAPRLVEYWEQDPCAARERQRREEMKKEDRKADDGTMGPGGGGLGVKVEAEFSVGEYEVVLLSAEDSTGLDTWLRQAEYNIPAGAEPALRPYVEGGMKFFVAKVDVEKVQFYASPDGQQRAMLSPLRFHYDSEEFSLPVRLGLINAQGPQDLLVHILAPQQRYEVANYPNVPIPTNLVVKDEVRERFGEFYVSLFDHTLAQNPGAVVTEYAWSAGSCDPCPDPPLSRQELLTLGADVLPRYADVLDEQRDPDEPRAFGSGLEQEFVLTRLHARYDADSLGEDLVFAAAGGLGGGRGVPEDGQLGMPTQTDEGSYSAFQGRYAILHFWDGAAKCRDPLWDTWGGPRDFTPPAVARQLAFESRDASLASFVGAAAHVALKLEGEAPADDRPTRGARPLLERVKDSARDGSSKGCACALDASSSSTSSPSRGLLGIGLGLGLLGLLRRRKRTSP